MEHGAWSYERRPRLPWLLGHLSVKDGPNPANKKRRKELIRKQESSFDWWLATGLSLPALWQFPYVGFLVRRVREKATTARERHGVQLRRACRRLAQAGYIAGGTERFGLGSSNKKYQIFNNKNRNKSSSTMIGSYCSGCRSRRPPVVLPIWVGPLGSTDSGPEWLLAVWQTSNCGQCKKCKTFLDYKYCIKGVTKK